MSAVAARLFFSLREGQRQPGPTTYKRFIILTQGRTGSQMLVQRCDSHPDAHCFGELLSRQAIYWGRSLVRPAHRAAREARDRNPLEFLEKHLWHSYPARIGAVGFKLMYGHLIARQENLRQMFNSDLSILWLERRNRFEAYLSALHAHSSNHYHAYDPESLPKAVAVTVNPAGCRAALASMDARRAEVASLIGESRVLRLYYEDLVDRPNQTDGELCTFLGLEPHRLRHSTLKFARGPLGDRVTNLLELQAEFAGTPWEADFHDADVKGQDP